MNNVAKKDSTVKTIKTNQSLVHIKHSITIRQYKYWHLILKFFAEKIEQGIQPDKNGFYFESRSKFAEYIGYDQMTKDLKADIEALRKEPIIINYLEKDGKPAIHGMGFISEYKITSNQIGYRLPSFIENVVRGDDESKKMFLLLNWTIFNSFTGKYEAIIYKLCKDYIGTGRTPCFTIEEYRDYIGLKKEEYPQFFRLNEWTIKRPLQAVNDSPISDITIEVRLEKVGRSVTGLYFVMEYKKQAVLPFEEFKPDSAFAFARIAISPDSQLKYLEAYSSEEIEATIERANEYIDKLNKDGSTINIGAIYNTAFKNHWGKERLEERRLKQAEIDKAKNKADWAKKKAEQAAQAEAEKTAQAEQARLELINLFESLSDDEKTKVINAVLNKHKPMFKSLNATYIEHGFDAYKHSQPFNALLIGEMKSYGIQKSIVEFECLPDDEKTKQIEFILHLNKDNKKLHDVLKGAYREHGLDAHRHNADVHQQLVEHLAMSKFVANLD